jgi:hypothetical protein
VERRPPSAAEIEARIGKAHAHSAAEGGRRSTKQTFAAFHRLLI